MRTSPRLLARSLLALATVAAGGVFAPARAQELGALHVQVRAAETGRPLVGAHVLLHGIGIGGTTDEYGIARLAGLQPGSRTLEVRYLGYGTQTALVMVTPEKVSTTFFDLTVQPIRLAEVRVRARRSILVTNGFFDRKGSGFGVFVTRQEIDKMQPRYLSDVLRRVAGINLTTSSFGGSSRATMRGVKVLGACPIQYYVDGTMTTAFNIDEVLPSDVEGLEIYRGASTIPPAYNKGSAMCGVIVIWTRVQ